MRPGSWACPTNGSSNSSPADVSDTNPRSVASQRTQQTAPQSEAEAQSQELRAVMDLACTIIRDDAVEPWLRTPKPDLGDRTPLEVIAAGEHQRLIDQLLALAEGVTS